MKFAFRFMWQKDIQYDMLTHGVLVGFYYDTFNLGKAPEDLRALLLHMQPKRPTKVRYLYIGLLLFYVRLTWELAR